MVDFWLNLSEQAGRIGDAAMAKMGCEDPGAIIDATTTNLGEVVTPKIGIEQALTNF